MRIAYLVHWDVSQESGVSKKIAAQAREWIMSGNDVCLFALSSSGVVWSGFKGIPLVVVRDQNILSRFTQTLDTLSDRIITWQPDVVYVRFTTYYPALYRLTTVLPTVLEVNADDLKEYRLSMSYIKYLYHRAFRKRLFGSADGIVAVTGEIADRLAGYQKETLILGNGIRLDDYPVLPTPHNDVPNLGFLGTSGQVWHGVDMIIELARFFPDWQFHMIGPKRINDWPSNIHAHGTLTRYEYESILARVDVAFGSLALHRTGMREACPLKVREYLAYGIPTIIGYQDTDLTESIDGVLRLDTTRGLTADVVSELEEFVFKSIGKRVSRRAIRHLDVAEKERKRLSFLKSVVEKAGNSTGA